MVVLAMVFFLSAFSLYGEKAATLNEVVDPDLVIARDGKIYVLERTTIFIYSGKDYKLIKRFGRAGEGPKEFMVRPDGPPMSLTFHKGKLVVASTNKVSYFTPEGEYLSEQKTPAGTVFYPVDGKYLGIGTAAFENNEVFIAFRLFDGKFQNPKLLYKTEVYLGNNIRLDLPMEALHYNPIHGDKLYLVAADRDFAIDCFDLNGKKLYSIEKKDWEKIKVTDAYKQKTFAWFKKHPFFGPGFEQIKKGMTMKKNYPAIKDLTVADDRIYVMTHKKKDGLNEIIIMDLKGKELKRAFVPVQEAEPFTYNPLFYDIEKGVYYGLTENENEETWDLHVKKL